MKCSHQLLGAIAVLLIAGVFSSPAAGQARLLGITQAGFLYEIDPGTGAAVNLGDTGIPGRVTAMTADPSGRLWVTSTLNFSESSLYCIPAGQVLGGAGTLVQLEAAPMTPYTWIQALAFDQTGTELLGAGGRDDADPTPEELITIRRSNATAEPIGLFATDLPPAMDPDNLHCIEDVDALAMSPSGMLFGWDSDGFACASNTHRFLSIDPATGTATPLADYPSTTSVFAMAFREDGTLFGARHPGNAGGPATLATITTAGVITNIAPIVDDSMTAVSTVVGLAFVDAGCPTGACMADLNGDGLVTGADLAALLAAWGTSCP